MIKKIFKILSTILKVVVSIIIISFAGIILMQRFSNSTFSIGGYRIFAVVTGSMEPVYGIGDVLLCKKVDTNTLKVGDDVTYLGKLGSFKDKVVTHRIIKIDEENGKKIFHTKGVASKSQDPTIEADQIYGKVTRKLVLLSLLHSYSTSNMGFFICVVIPIMLLVGTEIIQTMLEKYEKKKVAVGAGSGTATTTGGDAGGQNVTEEQLQQELIVLQKQILAQQNQNNEPVQQNVNIQTGVNQQPAVEPQFVQPEVTQDNSQVVQQPVVSTDSNSNQQQ